MPARPFATSVVKKLVEAGHTAYFAGGWVRDFLLKHPSDDIDIATSASVSQIQSIFPRTIPVGIAFGLLSSSSKKGTILKSPHSVKKAATTMGGAPQTSKSPLPKSMRSAEILRSTGCFGILSKNNFTIT